MFIIGSLMKIKNVILSGGKYKWVISLMNNLKLGVNIGITP